MDDVIVESVSGSTAIVIEEGDSVYIHPKANVAKVDIDKQLNTVRVLMTDGIVHDYNWITKVLY